MLEWIFDSTGGCTRCDNRDGYHDNEPERPHPNCDCEIYTAPVGGMSVDCFELEVNSDSVWIDYTENSVPLDINYDVEFTYAIECFGTNQSMGGTLNYTGTITIPGGMSFDDWAFMDELAVSFYDQAMADALDAAKDQCECEEEPDPNDLVS